ncbi:hypothetical protein [Mastigocladopsis repens]|uniref:hypothetical protein n=1 Tax=Mastigocladopsis repens TaxID=221287 RepID=UPI0038B9EB53
MAIAFVDKFGRKPLLILGSIGMTLTLGRNRVRRHVIGIELVRGNRNLLMVYDSLVR